MSAPRTAGADPRFGWDHAVLDAVLCHTEQTLTADDIERFRALMGYAATPAGETPVAPASMGLIHGLRLGWEHRVFPPGAIRMGDEDRFGVPARAGDVLRTELRIVERFEKKERRFMTYEMRTVNQRGERVCSVTFTAIVPVLPAREEHP
jgi:acyl dehydratase